MTKKQSAWVVGTLVALGGSLPSAGVRAQQGQRAAPLEIVQVHPDFYMIAGAGGNIAVNIGGDGVVLVNAGSAERADDVIAAVKTLTDLPIRYIITTSADDDHVGGNEKVARAGRPLLGGGFGGGLNSGAIIIATENVLDRMSAPTGQQAPYPVAAQPTETFITKQKNLFLNNQVIQVIRQPAAHTDGDSIVAFRRSDVVVTGDIVDMNHFPAIDVEKGGTVQGEIAALNRLIDIVVPSVPLPWREGGTQFIPGHGRVGEQAELVEYRDMVTITRDRVQSLIKKGMTLQQIQAGNPTLGFRSRYGADSGAWTTEMFVDAVYKGLTDKHPTSGASQDKR